MNNLNRLYEKVMLRENSNYNISSKFDTFNKRYFKGELTRISMGWNNRKNIGGSVTSRLNKKTDFYDPEKLMLSKFFEKNEEQLDGILAHEMVHVWQGQMTNKGDGVQHDSVFKKKLSEINSKTPFDVPISEENLFLIPSKKTGKNYAVVIMNENSIQVYSDSIKNDILENWDSVKKTAPSYFNSNKISLYMSNFAELENYPIKRKLVKKKNMVFYKLDSDLLDKIVKNSQLIKKW
jgi:hypothetical protein